MSPEHSGHLAGEVRHIIIVRALFLGDLLLSVPAWRALRRRYPRAEITLVGLPWAEAFVARMGHLIDRLLPFPGYPGIVEAPYDHGRTAAFLAAQRAYGYDLALQMHGDGTATNGFVADLGAQVSLGYARPGDQRLTIGLPYQEGQHEVARWIRLAAAVGAPVGDSRPEFRVTPGDEAHADALLGTDEGPLVAMHLGAKDPIRRWPARRFASLGEALRAHYGARLVLTGTAAEGELAAQVQQTLREPALDLTGRTDLGAFAAVISRANLLVSNDTGASHLAAAMGVPSVVLFGPSRPGEFAPLDRARHYVVDATEHAVRGEDPALSLRRLPVENVLQACIVQLSLWHHQRQAAPGAVTRAVGGGALCAG